MGRKPNTDTRRRQIVDALRAEICSVGYERASTRSIAKAAGLAAGLVHYHFASKQEILFALVDELIDDAERRFEQCVDPRDGDPRRMLARFVTSRVGLGRSGDPTQVGAWVGVIAEAMGQPGVRERVARWLAGDHARLTRLFKAAGVARPKEHAALLIAMILGTFSLHALAVPGIPKGYAETRILEWLSMA